jgi:hypothetical protein
MFTPGSTHKRRLYKDGAKTPENNLILLSANEKKLMVMVFFLFTLSLFPKLCSNYTRPYQLLHSAYVW